MTGSIGLQRWRLLKNGRTLSKRELALYLFDDLGVSRWTNKFSEVGIETVGDLIGKTEEDLLRIR